MISKEKLSFDPTDSDTLAASDFVGAGVFSGDDKTAIGHVSDALKVNFTNTSLAVTATDLDIRDLDFAQDSVDVSGSAVSITGTVAVTQSTSPWVVGDGGGSLTVDASDLDIRDLSHSQDSVKVGDGTDFLAVNNDGSINITDNGGSLTVDATNLDIRDLTAASDSVAAWLSDGSGNAITSSGGALDVNIQSSDIEINVEDDKANVALQSTQKNVTTTSGALLASQLAARKFLWAQNLGNKNCYVGASGVTTSTGIRMSPGSVFEIRLGPALSLHAVAEAGTQDFRLLEAS